MDYEKKYDDLMAKIEAVKKDPKIGLKDGDYYNGYVQKGIRSALDYLLQEESEDERIRKELVYFIQKEKEYVESKVKPENSPKLMFLIDALAYLEKQKGKRELDFAEGKVEGVRQTCQEIKDAMSLFEPKDLTPFEFTFRDYIDSTIRYCLAREGYQQNIKEWAADLLNLEKQKEQKPNVELIQKSWYLEGYHDRQFGKEPKWIIKTGEGGPKYEENPKYGQMLKEQEPAEWSDDLDAEVKRFFDECIVVYDAKIYGSIIEKVIEVSDYELTARHFAKWASEHCNKPAEWSEEDKRIKQDIENLIHFALRDGSAVSPAANTTKEDAINWLKSLRPQSHWKPSEEQMKSLQEVITLLTNLRHHLDDKNNLKSLYNDLKKL